MYDTAKEVLDMEREKYEMREIYAATLMSEIRLRFKTDNLVLIKPEELKEIWLKKEHSNGWALHHLVPSPIQQIEPILDHTITLMLEVLSRYEPLTKMPYQLNYNLGILVRNMIIYALMWYFKPDEIKLDYF
jgi:hypothetical protein